MSLNVLSKDARLWSFWGRGWLCVPTVIGWNNNDITVAGRLLKETHERLPNTVRGLGRLYRAIHWEPHVYVVKQFNNKEQACYQDLRLPASDACSGLIFIPTRRCCLSSPADSWLNKPDWETISASLRYLKETVRASLQGDIYVPLLGSAENGFDDDESLEMIEDTLKDSRDFNILSGERDEVSQPLDLKISTCEPSLGTTFSSTPSSTQQVSDNVSSGSLISHEFETVIPRRAT
jgi:hypothetical protein